jgi:hypothetical protein
MVTGMGPKCFDESNHVLLGAALFSVKLDELGWGISFRIR